MKEQVTPTVRVRRKDRLREEARQRRMRICDHVFSGYSVQQIATAQNVSMRRMNQMLQKWGISIPRRQGCRPLACVYLSGARAGLLDRLAQEAGVTPSEMTARIVNVVLTDMKMAKRLLGKLALPRGQA